MRTTAEKRHNDWKKAIRKRHIDRITSFPGSNDLYDNLHQYSKNKVHCSCPICRAKTNNKDGKGWAPVKNWSRHDKRQFESMENQILDNEEENVI